MTQSVSGTYKAAVVQSASVPFDPMASAEKAARLVREAAAGGARLAVFPEVFLGGYPKGASFGTPVGMRKPEGRDAFRRYHEGAIDLDGPEVALVAEACAETGLFVVIGCLERDGGTLYCTALFFDGADGLVGKHRKLMPTGAERLIWGFGDGSTMPVFDTSLGRIGAVICWENYMPALRLAMYDKRVSIYCTPTADDRDTWAPSMQHIALEGRCYVLSSCQHITRAAFPDDYECALGDDPDTIMMRGGSVIVSPHGQILAGPDFTPETILYADIDLGEVVRGKYDFDVVGHYARPDVFRLTVDETAQSAVVRKG
ncbi:carbon-nitrogen hydrolase family protein [Sphingomonas oryzagri]|uniref:Carbon-nitrogen hydrolase family protein n=1 Tax=Sphingomonas oryzagri TaxID=3042314 RepID=A0ABT6N4E6_9SPHN|nr:carbon-nitrogen hydrolase family protein [Sphingomonas oryzagri]MDH7640003.1 carbon-nitrogen hydrolase family protein [Sphingomonas oryzagri]